MDLASVIFYVFSLLMAYAGLRVITAKNPVHSALHLILLFFLAAGIWLILRAEFLAFALVLIYVGAVMVLMVFIIMMLDLEKSFVVNQIKKNYATALIIGIILIVDLALVINRSYIDYGEPGEDILQSLGSTKTLGLSIFSDFILVVEVASQILLVAMVAAVVLTLRGRKDARSQVISEQLAATKNERLTLVKTPANSAHQ